MRIGILLTREKQLHDHTMSSMAKEKKGMGKIDRKNNFI
jgi:hypothetical protein